MSYPSKQAKPLVWLITGCSSGFGEALTLLALNQGHKVIATSRNPSRNLDLVQKVKSLGGIWLQLDMTWPKSPMEKIVEEGIKHFGKIDVLVNNAGIALLGALEDVSEKEAHLHMQTNFFGPLTLTQCVLPHMRTAHSGTIVNISSGAGIDPRPSMSYYGATKFALEGMSQGLAKELAPFNIRVLIVQPGTFTTNMMNAAILTEKRNKEYKDTEVGKWMAMFDGRGAMERGFKSENDVGKGVQGIFEVVTGTGRGEGKEGHLRMLLSKDVALRAQEQVERVMKDREAFKGIWEYTGHDKV
ncbi:putative short chain oxidoreductase/dehydrogenase [Halenospora varia]|nr:putative short chain oxidoreductase/dehydrogenase [Halenospora varia]